MTVKDIIFRTSRQTVNLAIHNLAKLLDFDWSILNALANLITSDSDISEGDLNLSIKQIYKQRLAGKSTDSHENLAQFAKYIS